MGSRPLLLPVPLPTVSASLPDHRLPCVILQKQPGCHCFWTVLQSSKTTLSPCQAQHVYGWIIASILYY